MLVITAAVILFLALFAYYKFSYKPRALIKHYEKMLKDLGYKVYVQPFQVFGISFVEANEHSLKLYKDAQYCERTIFPQVDIVIGHIFDKMFVVFI